MQRQLILARWARQAPWNDCANLPGLVAQAHPLTPLGCVLADAEFDSERNHTLVGQQLRALSIIPAKRGKNGVEDAWRARPNAHRLSARNTAAVRSLKRSSP